MTKKSWLVFAVLCLAILGGLVWLSRQGESINLSGVDPLQVQSASSQNGDIADHTHGSKSPKVTIIEYGDFQCPGCSQASPALKAVTEKYKDHVQLIFRNNPLSSIHPNALAAAAAVESAGFQGKYWEMHDKLYAEQNSWQSLDGTERTNYFATTAQGLGLDVDRFKTDLAEADRSGARIKKKIAFDKSLAGAQNAASATPAILVNGKNVTNQYVKDGKLTTSGSSDARQVWADADAFGKLVIEPALKEKGVSLPQ
jgi:hypothetical protein